MLTKQRVVYISKPFLEEESHVLCPRNNRITKGETKQVGKRKRLQNKAEHQKEIMSYDYLIYS